MNRRWSPELELVMRLARVRPAAADLDRASALAAEGVDWDRVVRLAEHHRLVPLVHAHLGRLTTVAVPDVVTRRLHGLRTSIVRANLARYAAWLRLCDAFRKRTVTALTLKGFPIALGLYGDLGLRQVGDLDFLVRESDVSRAMDLFADMGYRPGPEWGRALRHVGLGYFTRHDVEIPLVDERRIAVDLHWRAAWNGVSFPVEEILAGPVPLRVEGRDVLVPPPDVDLAFLLLHAHGSGWVWLRWLVDIAEALDRVPPGDAAAMLQRIHDLGADPALRTALWLIDTLWGRIPESFARLPCDLRASRGMKDFLRTSLEEDHDWWWTWNLRRLSIDFSRRKAVLGSISGAITSVLRPSVREWAVVPLPRPLRFGYWLVRPIRLLLQAMAAGFRGRGVVKGRATVPGVP